MGCIKVRLSSSGVGCPVKGHSGFLQSTKDRIPAWGGLLFVYAAIFIPVLFSLLVAINILVWTKLRINHVFIFGEFGPPSTVTQAPTLRMVGLDVRSKIDHQQYVEVRHPLA